jgi:hypothetical protein
MKDEIYNPLLLDILATKRPTSDPVACHKYLTKILKKEKIKHTTDLHRNVTVRIGESDTCFTSHTDTVDRKTGKNVLAFSKGFITVAGGGVLGADCGSGIYLMIRMIKANKPGLYVFFAQEEIGRVGSQLYVMPKNIKKVVSFDRKGTDNLITHQMGERGCSKEFAQAFVDTFSLPFKQDDSGVFTDSYSFFETVPECINLSVGYEFQHTKMEMQDADFLEKLVDACIEMDWEALPAVRDPLANNFWLQDIEQYVYDNPETVAEYLVALGITAEDIEAFGSVGPRNNLLKFEDQDSGYWNYSGTGGYR